MAENNISEKVNKSELSVDAKEFVPRNAVVNDLQDENTLPFTVSDEMSQTISVLEAEPQAFDNMIEPLCDSLNCRVQHESQLIEIVDILVTQSSEKVNFQYIGARMCSYLTTHLIVQFPGGNFRQFMLKKCHQVFKLLEAEYKNSSRQSLLCGFSLFLAETIINSQGMMSVEPLINALCKLLQLLFDVSTEQTLLCVVKVLKLSGSILDRSNRSKIDDVFVMLKDSLVDDTSSKSVRMQFISLVELRARDWGSESSQDSRQQDLDNYDNAGYVPFYVPQLAADETVDDVTCYASGDYVDPTGWSHADFNPVLIDGAGEYHSQYETEDGMDPEMELAYEEFLAQSGSH